MLDPQRVIDSSFEGSGARAPQRIALFGATGSIGAATLDLARANPQQFRFVVLAAGRNIDLMHQLALEFRPDYVAFSDDVDSALVNSKSWPKGSKIVIGAYCMAELAGLPDVDIVVAAIVGCACLPIVMRAISANKKIALANKESLVVAGELVMAALKDSEAVIIPVDSEHSAIFQALQGARHDDISQLILTASGGPFLNTPISDLATVSPEEAIRHPRWSMGPKISIDSASMMNKGLELIEAYWLFGVPANSISVLVHPQSIVHSIVEFVDGVQIAQMSVPDMKGPIAYALSYPAQRIPAAVKPLDLPSIRCLEFFELDSQKFPAVMLARKCLEAGGAASAVFNIANEVAVGAFLRSQIGFLDIFKFVEMQVSANALLKLSSVDEIPSLIAELISRFQMEV